MVRVPRTAGRSRAGAAGRAAGVAVVAAVALAAGCGSPNVLLLTISADQPVETLDFQVRDQTAGVKIDEHLAVPLGDQDISQPGQALKIAERFSKPGTYLIHVVGHGVGGLQVATKAYTVDGAVDAKLHLVGLTSTTDADGDGYPSADACAQLAAPSLDCQFADCDDNDPLVHPFADERCNGRDDNCDGALGPDEVDADGDGFLKCMDCDPNATDWNPDYYDCRDCDDTRADVHPASRRDPNGHPAATEDCHTCGDGIDHNCDGTPNEGCNDADCDGYQACGTPGAPAAPLCDCDDHNAAVNPGAAEVCGDSIDNNCNGQTDEGCKPCDMDGDGFLRNDPANGCTPAAGEEDCDDTDSGIFPGAADSCSGKEGGCRLVALRGYCRFQSAADPPVIHDCKNRPPAGSGDPGCPPRACDKDGDGFMVYDPANGCNPPAALADCDDNDPHTFPGAPDYCGDGKAQNCNSDLPCDNDADGDHYNAGDDCDDTNPAIHPWAVEVCDGVDNDCDGLVDEGNPNGSTGATMAGAACTDSNVGECAKTLGICVCSRTKPTGVRNEADRSSCPDEKPDANAAPRCFGAGQPKAEVVDPACTGPADPAHACTCNGLDDNCNGVADDAPGEVPCPSGTGCRQVAGAWKCVCDGASSCDGCCTPHGYLDTCTALAQVSVGTCGSAGATCTSCDDGNPCTTDSCNGTCHNDNVAEHTGCGGGGQCRIPASQAGVCCATCWTGTACAAVADAGCGAGGGDCAAASTSCGLCRVCNGQGACGNVAATQDPNNECSDDGVAACGKNGTCDGNGACALYAAGSACALCKTCDGSGHCGTVAAGQDPNNQCADEAGTNVCGHDGVCDGNGACRYYTTSVRCGTCKQCDGAGGCTVTPADDGACGTIACGGLTTTCRTYSDITTNRCQSFGACKPPNQASTCSNFVNTAGNTRCANCKICDGNGACGNVPAGQDPKNDCAAAAASTCGLNGQCDGTGSCQLYAAATSCGTCSQCNGGGSCNQTPADDAACGTIHCDALNTTCRTYTNLTTNRCASLGTCKPANPTNCVTYNNTAGTTSCGLCEHCDGSGGCTATPADDASCGTINCASLNTACATYTNLTSNRCKSFGTCKSANTTDCGIVTYGGTGVGCGTCKHCDGSGGCVTAGAGTGCATCKTCDASGGCTQNIGAGASSGGACATQAASTCGTTGNCDGSGGCQKWAAATACGLCSQCNGSGACNQMPADDPACNTINCASLDTTCRTYTNLTTNRCKALGTCKGANTTDCTTFNNTTSGTHCGTCQTCDGAGSCANVADGTDPNNDCPGSQICCAGACAHRADGGGCP